MKTFFKLVCLSLLVTIGMSCSKNKTSKEKDSAKTEVRKDVKKNSEVISERPEDVAIAFSKALLKCDIETVKLYLDEKGQAAFTLIEEQITQYKDKMSKTDPKIEVVSCEVSEDGNKAKVKLKETNYYEPETDKIDAEGSDGDYDLKKIDGKWKVLMPM